jgi:hypothetical protein
MSAIRALLSTFSAFSASGCSLRATLDDVEATDKPSGFSADDPHDLSGSFHV